MFERQLQSGLSQAKFCDRERISQNSFSFWKSTIRKRDAERALPSASNQRSGDLPTFIPVVVSGSNDQVPACKTVVAEIHLSHILISVLAGADIETLRNTFAACRECFE
jgi:hypothetical protein